MTDKQIDITMKKIKSVLSTLIEQHYEVRFAIYKRIYTNKNDRSLVPVMLTTKA